MRHRTCTFAGHSQLIPSSLINEITILVEHFVSLGNEAIFLIGGMGEFDDICAKAVRAVQRKHIDKSIKLYLVCPYLLSSLNRNKSFYENIYDEIIICDESENAHYKAAIKIRNKYMVDRSSLIIGYVTKNFGGAYETLKYAKQQEDVTVINLAVN